MPFSMTKDAQGNLLEGKGITPDYPLDPMSDEEVNALYHNAPGAIDRGLAKAMEILK